MSTQSVTTIRAQATGIARRRVAVALFAGVAALPLVSMGITIPSAVAKSRAETERTDMRERLAQRESVSRSLGDYRGGAALEEVEVLHEMLAGLIPSGVEPLDEFGRVRDVASELGLHLGSVKAVRTHPTGGAGAAGIVQPGSVVIDEVLVTLTEAIDPALELVESLRRRGLPTLVLGLELARQTPRETRFQTELRLGFVRRVPGPRPSAGATIGRTQSL